MSGAIYITAELEYQFFNGCGVVLNDELYSAHTKSKYISSVVVRFLDESQSTYMSDHYIPNIQFKSGYDNVVYKIETPFVSQAKAEFERIIQQNYKDSSNVIITLPYSEFRLQMPENLLQRDFKGTARCSNDVSQTILMPDIDLPNVSPNYAKYKNTYAFPYNALTLNDDKVKLTLTKFSTNIKHIYGSTSHFIPMLETDPAHTLHSGARPLTVLFLALAYELEAIVKEINSKEVSIQDVVKKYLQDFGDITLFSKIQNRRELIRLLTNLQMNKDDFDNPEYETKKAYICKHYKYPPNIPTPTAQAYPQS